MSRGRQFHNEMGPIAPRKRFGNYLDDLILDAWGFILLALFNFFLVTDTVLFVMGGLWDNPFWVISLLIAYIGDFQLFRELRR